jgi:mannose/fructose-specific phosphotransferase system component IIA
VAVVTGVNLPMLLEFVFHRDMPFDELLPRLEAKAREGIRVLPPS